MMYSVVFYTDSEERFYTEMDEISLDIALDIMNEKPFVCAGYGEETYVLRTEIINNVVITKLKKG